jgi:hypothetical protein
MCDGEIEINPVNVRKPSERRRPGRQKSLEQQVVTQ